MDIKLKARLSAYSRFPQKSCECDAEVVTKEDIDSLFGEGHVNEDINNNTCLCNNKKNTVAFTDIDSLFR